MIRQAAGCGWERKGEKGPLGAGGHGEVQGDLGSGEAEQWSSTVGGGVMGRVSLVELAGAGSQPLQVVF